MRLTLFVITMVLVVSYSGGCNGTRERDIRAPAEETPRAENTPHAENEPLAENTSHAEETSGIENTPAVGLTPAANQYEALLAEYEEEGGARVFAKRFLQLAEQHPQDPVAADALLWVVSKVRGKTDTTRALNMLLKYHIESPKLGPASKDITGSRSIAAEKLLRAIVEQNPHEQVRAQACFYLGSLLDLETSLVEQLRAQPELAPRVLQYYGKEYGNHLTSVDPALLEKQREQVYEQILETFPDVELNDSKLGMLAEKMLFRIRHLSVGKVAPEIEGEDIHGKKFKLSDFRGKVVMLTFWGHW